MRVISGSARGKKLLTLAGEETRPTTDRVKESMFNLIQFEIEGARCLDLFAGSGALGIEALSRGAEFCLFADQNPEAVRMIQKNLGGTGLWERGKVENKSFESLLYGHQGEPFDLIFLDPPYHGGFYQKVSDLCSSCPILAPCGIIICESEADENLPDPFGGAPLLKSRIYGKTKVTVYKRS